MFDEIISKCKLQVRRECQFFGALMLFATIKKTKKIDTACTDGKDIYFNLNFLNSLNSSEQNALMLHEVLHMALLHVTRRQNNDKNIKTESGNLGSKIFLLKWGISIDFFKKFILKSDTVFKGELPKKVSLNFNYLIGLILCKINYIYVRYIYNLRKKIKISNEID